MYSQRIHGPRANPADYHYKRPVQLTENATLASDHFASAVVHTQIMRLIHNESQTWCASGSALQCKRRLAFLVYLTYALVT